MKTFLMFLVSQDAAGGPNLHNEPYVTDKYVHVCVARRVNIMGLGLEGNF